METDDIFKEAVLDRLGSKYVYIKDLGEGAFSSVYLVRHNFLEEGHALKIMNSRHILQKLQKEDISTSKQKFEKIKTRFLEEAKLYKRINHPGIVKIFDVDVMTDPAIEIESPYMIMKYIKGQSLGSILKSQAPLDFETAVKLSIGILDALKVIHHNDIIHRDLKPENVMVEVDMKPVLIDFGLAKDLIRSTKLTTTGKIMGTPVYMSPEQCYDSSKVGPRSDIFSLGVILFEMLTGKLPFRGKDVIETMLAICNEPLPDPRGKRPELPASIVKILEKATEKKVDDRFENASNMIEALENWNEN
jgi:serine/threonine-protein kinase